MKFYKSFLIASALAYISPALAFAQPAPPPAPAPLVQPAPPGAPGYPAPRPGDKHDDYRPGQPVVPPNAVHPAPIAQPGPAPSGHPSPHPAAQPKPATHPTPAPHVYSYSYKPAPPGPPPAPGYNPARLGMHANDFNILLHSVDNAPFKSDKVTRIRAAKDNYFTSAQVKTLLLHLPYDSDRTDVAVMLYSHVVDKNNWFIIYDAIDFASSRERIERELGL